ncbi:hypothetical protein [Modicisalibacter xianhensis]|nr:hypothetical protein [Halomonas xianhensis]
MTQKMPALFMAAWIVFACQASQAADAPDAAELQRQAAKRMLQGIHRHDDQALSRAMTLAERALALSPDNGGALLTKLQIQLYRHQYEQALASVNAAQQRHPEDDSLSLLRCMLVGKTQGSAPGDACYADLQRGASQPVAPAAEARHASDTANSALSVSFNQVAAAILGDSPQAEALAETYIAQTRELGGIEAEDVARQTVEALQDGSYVAGVLMI